MNAYDTPALLHEIIAIGAIRHPERMAFRCRDQQLSYQQLGAAVARQAGQLRELGVKPGDRVGVMLPKCIQAPIAVFGIMAAGAAYVPLDPTMPARRLNLIIADCDLKVLISHPRSKRTLTQALKDSPDGCSLTDIIAAEPFKLDGLDKSIAIHSLACDDNAPAFDLRRGLVTEAALAYIMYTSGSTGQPKGLMHTHASGLAYARMSARLYGLSGTDRLASHSPLHFDMSTLDYFSGPLAGASTVILTESHMKLPASMSQLIDDELLTIWYSVPWALQQLLHHGVLGKRSLSSLRWVLYGGEPFPPRHLAALMKHLPKARFGNVYGPAEVNQVSFHEIAQPATVDASSVPIGCLVNNADGVIVTDDNQPVATGDAGELVVRTPQMMQGYWKRPELNASTLIRRPDFRYFDSIWCRTGDLVREDENGVLHFLGRKDRLVKCRGNRVELDEVEAALVEVEGVKDAVAFIYAGDEEDTEIGAAISFFDPTAYDEKTVRRSLAAHLCAYAVPGRILLIESMPRTGSDKVDRIKVKQWFQSTITDDQAPSKPIASASTARSLHG